MVFAKHFLGVAIIRILILSLSHMGNIVSFPNLIRFLELSYLLVNTHCLIIVPYISDYVTQIVCKNTVYELKEYCYDVQISHCILPRDSSFQRLSAVEASALVMRQMFMTEITACPNSI